MRKFDLCLFAAVLTVAGQVCSVDSKPRDGYDDDTVLEIIKDIYEMNRGNWEGPVPEEDSPMFKEFLKVVFGLNDGRREVNVHLDEEDDDMDSEAIRIKWQSDQDYDTSEQQKGGTSEDRADDEPRPSRKYW